MVLIYKLSLLSFPINLEPHVMSKLFSYVLRYRVLKSFGDIPNSSRMPIYFSMHWLSQA